MNIADLLPHSEPMILIDSLVERGDSYIVCCVVVDPVKVPLSAGGKVPISVGIEYLSQAAAISAGLAGGEEEPEIGFLMGVQRMECKTSFFETNQKLLVRVEQKEGAGQVAQFFGLITDEKTGEELLAGQLTFYIPSAEERHELKEAV